jgi:hypothetical protein
MSSTTGAELETVLATFWDRAQQAQESGHPYEARAWLEAVVELDADDVNAWLALAALVPDARERMLCYSRALELAPGHPVAKKGLRDTRRQLR